MKKKTYSHIIKTERLEISVLLGKQYNIREIALALGRSPGTISEEIRRNSTHGNYDPHKANHKAYVKRKYSKYQGMKVVGNLKLREYVETKLKDDWSPEEISGRIEKVDTHLKYISPKGVYKFVYSAYGRILEKYLTYKSRRKRNRQNHTARKLEDRVFIDQRPKIVDKRRRFGDWEGDFIVSGKNGRGVLLVLHERKARFVFIKRIPHITIALVHSYIAQMTGGLVSFNTLTLDNDIIFRKHKELSKILGVPVYFCHPYHSWEKGGVENTNKLIRRYIPKLSDISIYTDEYIQVVQEKLNNRPRKCLKYKTPNEVMRQNNQFKKEIEYLLNDILKVGENKKAECSA